MALEKDLESKCRKYVQTEYGGQLLKMSTLKGIPDRLVLLPGGRAMFCEFKQSGKTPRKLQNWWLRVLHRLGFASFWCDEYQEFKYKVDFEMRDYEKTDTDTDDVWLRESDSY